jgi:arylsulfatase A-like enzyme/Flp pilus assembly protein TadD
MRFSRVQAAVWAILVTSLTAQEYTKSPVSPDVFLVTIDTLRADHVHCYGYNSVRTPALDDLAKDGVRFAHAFTPSPITNTSHTSILTGLLPSTHGVTDFAVPLAHTHPTLAELLKNKGYKTAAFIGSVVLDSTEFAPGLDQGFDFYDNFPHPGSTKSRWGRLERRGMDVAQRAEVWLNMHPAGPRFVWIHLYDPHDPYDPPPPYSRVYKDRLYDGEIAYADSALMHFVSRLKQHRWYDNSIIIAVGDHGEGLGEHHEQTHGIFLYDSTVHVPLIVKLPGARNAGKAVGEQVRTVDILPTILDLLHIPNPTQFDGASLRPYFSDSSERERTILGETDYPVRFGWAPLRSVRANGLKFIEAPRPELYDLSRDPREEENDYAPWDPNVQKFRALLADRRNETPAPTASLGSIPQSTIDELKALGYLTRRDAASSTNVPEPSLLPDPKDKIEEQNLLHQAMIASEGGKVGEARAALEKAAQRDPDSYLVLSQLGELELQDGDSAAAVNHLRRARELRPNDAALAFHEGQAMEQTGDLDGARAALTDSLKLDPTRFAARLLLGQICLRLKELKAAEDQFAAALLLRPREGRAQLGLVKVQVALGNFLEAKEKLEPMARFQPGNAEVFELLAQSYAGLGKADKSEQAAKRASALRGRSRK